MCGLAQPPHTSTSSIECSSDRLIKIIGPTSALQTHARRTVAAATYMNKLKLSELAPRLRCLLPPPMLPPDTLRTRRQVSRTRRHPHQLTNPLSRDSPNYLKRSFPYSTIDFWNCLHASVFPAEHPTAKHMNTFKRRVNRHMELGCRVNHAITIIDNKIQTSILTYNNYYLFLFFPVWLNGAQAVCRS